MLYYIIKCSSKVNQKEKNYYDVIPECMNNSGHQSWSIKG